MRVLHACVCVCVRAQVVQASTLKAGVQDTVSVWLRS